MNFDLILRQGTVVTSSDRYQADIGVAGGRIIAIGELSAAVADSVYDASGKIVFPGFIDEHVHSRDPGLTHKEDFAHSSRAAAGGGITTVVEMPNTVPPVSDPTSFREVSEKLSQQAFVDFAMWALVLGDENLAEIGGLAEAGAVGFKLFWGYALDRETRALVYHPMPNQEVIPPPDDGQIFAAFQEIAKTGRPVAIHAENADVISLLSERERNSGAGSYASLLRSRPPFTEAMTVDTGIRLAEAAGVHLHVLHVSSAEATERVAMARAQGLRVSAESCPHYLVLTDEDFERLGTLMKIYPPVREEHHQNRLWEALRAGDIQTLGSDHAPHTEEEKAGELWAAPAGASSVQATVPLMLNAVNQGRLSLQRLAAVLSENPAKLLGLADRKGRIAPGADADFTVVDLERRMTIRKEDTYSKSKAVPYDGMTVTGAPVATFVRGRQLMADGRLIEERPTGRLLKPRALE